MTKFITNYLMQQASDGKGKATHHSRRIPYEKLQRMSLSAFNISVVLLIFRGG
jgi:hypothetical protein